MDRDCKHPKHYGHGDMRSCANPLCAVWLTPDAEPILQPELQVAIESVVIANDPPPAVAAERTVTIAGTKGKRKEKR